MVPHDKVSILTLYSKATQYSHSKQVLTVPRANIFPPLTAVWSRVPGPCVCGTVTSAAARGVKTRQSTSGVWTPSVATTTN